MRCKVCDFNKETYSGLLDTYPPNCVVNDLEICSVCDQEISSALYYRHDLLLQDEGEIEIIDEENDSSFTALPERTGRMHIE